MYTNLSACINPRKTSQRIILNLPKWMPIISYTLTLSHLYKMIGWMVSLFRYPFWAVAPEGRCLIECRGYFVHPYVCTSIHTYIHPSVRPSVCPSVCTYVRPPGSQGQALEAEARAWRLRPGPVLKGQGPEAKALSPWPRGQGPEAWAPRPGP